MFISLKPPEERDDISTQVVIDRLRRSLYPVAGHPAVHVRGPGRARRRTAERLRLSVHALQHRSRALLQKWAPIVAKRMETVEGITDISSDRDPGGLQLTLNDRPPEGVDARRPGAGHRQRAEQRLLAAADLDHLHPAQPVHDRAGDRSEIPDRSLQSRAHLRRGRRRHAGAAVGRGAHHARASPLAVFHSQSFPSTTVSFNLLPDVPLQAATHKHPARGRRVAHARRHPRQL